jgi:uncharacterized RDD family membrane protein YckC
MEKTFIKIEELAGHIREYVNNNVETAKLKTAEKSSAIFAGIMARIIIILIFVFAILFASVALACLLAKITGALYWGFLIVAGLYLFFALIIWSTQEKILRLSIMNFILEQLFKTNNNEKN